MTVPHIQIQCYASYGSVELYSAHMLKNLLWLPHLHRAHIIVTVVSDRLVSVSDATGICIFWMAAVAKTRKTKGS